MKKEHKLRLVSSLEAEQARQAQPAFLDEAEPTEEELREAEALRLALENGEDPLLGALRAAHGLTSMDDELHDDMIERALHGGGESAELDATPTPSERVAAERLRAAIEDPQRRAEDAPLVEVGVALRAAYRPRDIEPLRNEALIARALSSASSRRKSARVLPFVTAAIAGVTAIAAGIALYVAPASNDASVASAPALTRSRSAVELFDPATPFPRSGGESARVDRIASARATDLRSNRFALWGVR